MEYVLALASVSFVAERSPKGDLIICEILIFSTYLLALLERDAANFGGGAGETAPV